MNQHPQRQPAPAQIPAATQKKLRGQAQDFEAMFLNSMFSQMTSGIKGEGPFGDTPGTGVWRSMLTEQYAKSIAASGGIGIAEQIQHQLISLQEKSK